MRSRADEILAVLDACCDSYTFPMLDNGYVYLAATRLSLFHSPKDWAMVIEVFGFSPRAGVPDTCIHTFSSRLHNRDRRDRYVNAQGYRNYLANNPHNEQRSIHPIEEGDWQDEDNCEWVAPAARQVELREWSIDVPKRNQYEQHGIELEHASHVHIFELCRYLASVAREDVLATPEERRISVRPELVQLLQLEEWHHPDVADDAARPSGSETFQQLARVLETGDVSLYRPSMDPNTHWSHWPEGGRL